MPIPPSEKRGDKKKELDYNRCMAKNNSNLHSAKRAKNDEFYTLLSDIENELKYYKKHFEGAVICCPCDETISEDGTKETMFLKHFIMSVNEYNWKRLICIGYEEDGRAIVHFFDNHKGAIVQTNKILSGNGDFRNAETIELMNQSDVIVTNPPFSLFREFLAVVLGLGKKMAVIGNKNAVSNKETFPLIKDNKLWLGYTSPAKFIQPGEDELKNMTGLTRWFTNMEIKKQEEVINLGTEYERGKKKGLYGKYDNYDAINVDKVTQIPMDYEETMGVPITFLDHFNPNQFEILGLAAGNSKACGFNFDVPYTPHPDDRGGCAILNGQRVYSRLLIRKKK